MDSLRKLRSKHVLGIFFFFICFFLVASDYGICSQTGQFSNRESNFGLLGIGLLTTSLFFAHASAPNDYSLKRNTISELAGQNYKYAWIMRSGFIGFGLFTAAAALDGAINSTIHPIKSASLGLYGA
ncbi:MAG: DUF998 domain-containing protein [Bdellovibrionales bacterium]|nr:DUF998 domain-containing protein [Bdellovibrionales bacterium]